MNGSQWLARATASVERATLAARVAGKTHETTTDWLAARADARAAEDEAVTLLCQAALALNGVRGGLPDWPADAVSFRERAMYQRGVADGRSADAKPDAPAMRAAASSGRALTANGQPPAWDAEECRNAALEVLRAVRGYNFDVAPLNDALHRLSTAVQREQ